MALYLLASDFPNVDLPLPDNPVIKHILDFPDSNLSKLMYKSSLLNK